MKLGVPTFKVKCTLREEIISNSVKHAPGEVVELPYGIALQGMAQGVVGAIVGAESAHLVALEYIGRYGADSWFPSEFQTLAILQRAQEPAQ
jgi:hypothetical protein